MNQRTPMKQSAHTHTHFCRLALLLALAVGAVMGLALQASADPPRYRIIVIDPPPSVPTLTEFREPHMGINNRGEVVSTANAAPYHPFVWLPTANYGKSPGTHDLPAEGWTTEINDNGIIVGRASTFAYFWNLNTDAHGVVTVYTGEPDDPSEYYEPKEGAYDINNLNVVVGWGWYSHSPFIAPGFRVALNQPAEYLGPVLASHTTGYATGIADSGFTVGYTLIEETHDCGADQQVYRAAFWEPASSTGHRLATLGDSLAEPVDAVSHPTDVNNAALNMIVGYGEDPDDLTLPCRQRALFWEDAMAEPLALPYLTVNGQPWAEPMQATAIADAFDEIIQIVGRGENNNTAVLWRRVNNAWEAIDLNTVSPCGATEWANLSHAFDINSCGWIAGIGILTDGSPRAFVLIPADACPGDITGSEVTYPDGKVNVNDLLGVIAKWATSDCVADITGDSTVNVSDLLAVINGWGTCACFPTQDAVESLSQELTDAGLTQGDWNEYLDVAINGTQTQKENYNCWMQRLMSGCTTCPSCPGRNPFGP